MASRNAGPITPDHPPSSPSSSSRGIIVEDVLGGHSISTGGHHMDTADVMEDSDGKNGPQSSSHEALLFATCATVQLVLLEAPN
ncbi:hypothetical protein POTOM_059313 [Populus tomentosa]|uniref:Uncharacterized protein n=1 Tax=Populus tomentosa TaxID=118781 RepID=A0A8X7XPB2_POPTO|nr:hypothetical protein POTOM_059313 [Populus tomentosa]